MKKTLLLLIVAMFTVVSCKKEKDNDDDNINKEHVVFYSGTIGNKSIDIYFADETIETGFNSIAIQLKDDNGVEITNANVTIAPEMDMGEHHHGCPVVQPTFTSLNKWYEGKVIFTMPSGDMGTWTLTVIVDEDEITIPITVEDTGAGTKHVGSYTGLDENKYFVTLVKPFNPRVGMNDIYIMVHQADDHDYIPVDNLIMEVDPQMTSMGHGSPNNVDPVFTEQGVYLGEVNFTMTGDWRINLKISNQDEVIIENAYLDILF